MFERLGNNSQRETEPPGLSSIVQLYTRRGFLRMAGRVTGAVLIVPLISGCGIRDLSPAETTVEPTPSPSPTETRSLESLITSFSWEDAYDEEKSQQFTQALAAEYMRLTQSSRVDITDLNAAYYNNTDDYIQAVREVEPGYFPSVTQWGYTHYASERVFLNLQKLQQQSEQYSSPAGLSLADALFHEWGHLDVEERHEGELIRNDRVFFYSPNSGQNERWNKYRGAAVYTDTYYGYLRFDEVLNETITIRRLTEEIGLTSVISAEDYYNNGVDVFYPLTLKLGITVEELYQYHATSDFEGLARRIGSGLPGQGDDLIKGVNLFTAIHQENQEAIRNTGVFEILK